MTHIRAMTKNDLAEVSRLLGQSWRRTYSAIMGPDTTARLSDDKHAPEKLAVELEDNDKMSFVAERPDGSIAGYAMAAMDDGGDVMLDRLHIEPNEFGTGLATDLLHAVLAAHAGIPSIALEVIEGNDRAIAFYQKHGFEAVERRPAAHGVGGHASLIMRRLLPRA
ncbi:GNAT family N-acetyltransferase [Mesorhizobium sp.]|uniref:GNAT family N-acetyltransferase n=1 Tax=Mesorhizobium sp. TaxID=1871066 RepID=UPI000FE6DD75|nr:GNAT family N-acetyltransferase [Mesorhizobium sp.]RWA60835.1 MAG: GNAT family N-acetyltransferase [Mesorhizobium sp.]